MGGGKLLQLSLSVFLTPGTLGVHKYSIPAHVYFRLWYFYSITSELGSLQLKN